PRLRSCLSALVSESAQSAAEPPPSQAGAGLAVLQEHAEAVPMEDTNTPVGRKRRHPSLRRGFIAGSIPRSGRLLDSSSARRIYSLPAGIAGASISAVQR